MIDADQKVLQTTVVLLQAEAEEQEQRVMSFRSLALKLQEMSEECFQYDEGEE